MAPEFDAAFIGMSIGETKTFTVVFPEDGDSPWEGEEGHFEVEVLGVKSEELPAMDDELAQEIGDYETFDELKADIYDRVQNRLWLQAESDHHEAVLAAMVEAATISYPPVTLDREIDLMIDEQVSYFSSFGIESAEEYFRITGKTEEEFREQLRPVAQSRVARRLVLDAIAEREQFEISDDEVEQFFVRVLSQDPEEMALALKHVATNEDYRTFIVRTIQRERAEDLMIEIAKGEEVPEPGQHPVMEAPPEPEETHAEESVEGSPADASEDAPGESDDAALPDESEEISQPETTVEDTPEA